MRLKLDENLGLATQVVFVDGGHDVDTVVRERLKIGWDSASRPSPSQAE
jgi:hypothetical protein